MAKDISRTLIVGLGGTGQTVIRDIKKRLLRTYGEIPKLVKFLEFDTDGKKEEEDTAFQYYHNGESHQTFQYQIENAEYLLTPFLGMQIAENDSICNTKINTNELQRVQARLNNKGAGGYRVCGRTIFLQNSENIIAKLQNTIQDLRLTNLTNQEVANGGYNVIGGGIINVFVIASLAGGTGSSAFMDISRMLQIAGINVQYNVAAGQDQIFGMFFLPKFFEGKPNTHNIRINTYTALSELDYVLDLNDSINHPAGCLEIANDNQDYAGPGGTNNNKRVVYNGVYLIDALTPSSRTNSFDDAASYVASFIAASISADANTIISSFVNSDHKMTMVDGRYQNYSGLGYCELRFNRQELVRYLLNRKLISTLEDYKNGGGVHASEIVKNFIDTQGLDEGVRMNADREDTRAAMNQLTDAIIKMDGSHFNEIHMAAVDTGNAAATQIENSKIVYLNAIATATQEAISAFSGTKEQLLSNLRSMLNKYQNAKGFSIFPDIARQLTASFAAMKKGLEEELCQFEEKFDKIEGELTLLKTSIAANSSRGFLGFGNRRDDQENYLLSYTNKVRFDTGNTENPTLARLKVEMARKSEAVAIYEEMIRIVSGFYKAETRTTINGPEEVVSGTYFNVSRMYNSLIELLDRENDNYKPSKVADKETLYADAYFKDYFEKNSADTMSLTTQALNNLEDYFGGLFGTQPNVNASKLVEMRQTLLNLLPADGLIRKIQEERMSIDEVFIHCFGDYNRITNKNDFETFPQLKMLQQLDGMFEPLWQYLPFSSTLAPDKNMVVGVYNTANHIFNAAHGYSQTINGWNGQRQYVSLGDPDRIAFMLMETAIPAHKLMNVREWANEYNQRKSATYTFSDRRLEDIEMIMPGAHDQSEEAWAYGWLLGLISNPTNRRALRVKPSRNYIDRKDITVESNGDYDYFNIEHPKDIYECHRKFINDQELSQDILNQAMEIIDRDPVESIIKIKEWINDRRMWSKEIRGKEEVSLLPKERKVIQDEVKYLAMLFSRLGYGLKLDNSGVGHVTHDESDVLKHREEAMKTKDNKTNSPKA